MTRVHLSHRRCTGLPIYGEGSAYTDALESFNRASHSDALREMQIVPAEEMQPETIVGVHVGWVVPMAFLLSVAITVIGANSL